METYGLEKLGIINAAAVYRNLTPAQLTEHALRRGEGTLSNTGALVVKTGKYTGRSANDKFIVDTPAIHDDIAWGKVNRPMDKARFDAIYAKVTAYLQNKDVFIFDGFAGADPKYTKGFRIVNELASQNLFIHQLLRRPTADQLKDFHEDYTIIAAPGFKCIPEIDGTAGPTTPCSTSRAAAMPSASTSPRRVSRRFTTPSASAPWWRTWSWTPRPGSSISTTIPWR